MKGGRVIIKSIEIITKSSVEQSNSVQLDLIQVDYRDAKEPDQCNHIKSNDRHRHHDDIDFGILMSSIVLIIHPTITHRVTHP